MMCVERRAKEVPSSVVTLFASATQPNECAINAMLQRIWGNISSMSLWSVSGTVEKRKTVGDTAACSVRYRVKWNGLAR